MHSLAPIVFAYLRVLGSAIILNTVVHDHGPIERRDEWRLAGFSVLAIAINQFFFLGGLALTSAHVAAILITVIPVFALAAAIGLGFERATVTRIGGIALAGAGALLVVAHEGLDKSLIGDLMIMTSSLAYAFYLFAIGSVVMLPIAAWPLMKQDWRHVPGRAWLGLALVIIGPTVAAYLLNAWALANAESSLVAAYAYLQPVMTTVLAAIFLGEKIQPVAIVAGVMIIGGIYVASGGRRPASEPAA